MIKILTFDQFTPDLLYKVMQLRFNTFVLEQKSMYEEFDNIDYDATHVLLLEKEQIVAYMRIYMKEKDIVSFGRVVVSKEHREKGYGRNIVKEGLKYIKENIKFKSIEIEAQEYLKGFYESFGFKQTSQPFDDCGVMHIGMSLKG